MELCSVTESAHQTKLSQSTNSLTCPSHHLTVTHTETDIKTCLKSGNQKSVSASGWILKWIQAVKSWTLVLLCECWRWALWVSSRAQPVNKAPLSLPIVHWQYICLSPENDQLLLISDITETFAFICFPIILTKVFPHIFRGFFPKITGCVCTPGLKMPIMYLSWLNLFKFVSVFPFSTLCCCAAFSVFTCAVSPLWYTTAQCTVQNFLSLFKDQLQIEPNQTV